MVKINNFLIHTLDLVQFNYGESENRSPELLGSTEKDP